jgi:hypothetical protein
VAEKTPHVRAGHSPESAAATPISPAASQAPAGAKQALEQSGLDREVPSIATVALVGVGVAVLEPELIPGILIGAGAVLAPKILPALGSMLRPMVKGVVKAGYSAAMSVREAAAEGREQMEDLVVEARAEHEAAGDGHGARSAEPHPALEHPSKRPSRPARSSSEGNAPPAANL